MSPLGALRLRERLEFTMWNYSGVIGGVELSIFWIGDLSVVPFGCSFSGFVQ